MFKIGMSINNDVLHHLTFYPLGSRATGKVNKIIHEIEKRTGTDGISLA